MKALISARSVALVGLIVIFSSSCSKPQYSLPDQSQGFAQQVTYNNKVDIIIMIDNSSSMNMYQANLAAEAPGMIASLNNLGMDYNIVVVTSDMRSGGNGGQFIGSPKILNAQTANVASLLQGKINIGTMGSDLERGLSSIQTVLQPSYLNGAGAGFLRSDAMLAMIVLSSEDDYSSGTAQSYIDFFNQLKPAVVVGKRSWILNFIGVPNLASTCSSASWGYLEPGLKWLSIANASGGLVEPICQTSLATSVSNIQKRIISMLTDFPLRQKPIIESISVRINGINVPRDNTNGWEYIESTNVIRFHGGYVPLATDSISVDFTPAEAN